MSCATLRVVFLPLRGPSQQVQAELNEATFAVLIGVALLPHPCRLSQGGKEVSRRCGRS